jgi:hypothetical protein
MSFKAVARTATLGPGICEGERELRSWTLDGIRPRRKSEADSDENVPKYTARVLVAKETADWNENSHYVKRTLRADAVPSYYYQHGAVRCS